MPGEWWTSTKMQKQMNYANKKEIPFVVLAGESEIQAQIFTLKNMETGEQKSVSAEELINILSQSWFNPEIAANFYYVFYVPMW